MAACNALPPVPAVFGEGWRDEWLRRIESTEPWLLRWLEEQIDGPYWRHGSLRPGYEQDRLPDDDRRRLGRRLPQQHVPHLRGAPLPEAAADRAMEPHVAGDVAPRAAHRPRAGADPLVRPLAPDERNGIDEEPPVVVFARRSTRPAPDLAEMRGEWRAESTWPPARLGETTLRPGGSGTDEIHVRGDVGANGVDLLCGEASVGPARRSAPGRRSLARLRLGAARR